jgi:dipeptidyl aminopeptidase/acylaminoacyl peptidase
VRETQKAVAPYGSWASPVTPEALVDQAVGLSDVQVDGRAIYWSEARPQEGGRQVIVAWADGRSRDVLPEGFSARTLVHEYGGRCFAVDRERLVFSNHDDQRLWLIEPGTEPTPLTPEPPARRAWRYADPEITADGGFVICVRESHTGGEVVNDLVAVPLAKGGGEPIRLAGGHDFYSAPRLSPDGTRLAWISWDHPDMPWDSSELWVAELTSGAGAPLGLRSIRRLAGGSGESVSQPRWSPAGSLHYLSDRSGWWNLYDETGLSLCPMEAEFGGPDWVFGNSTYCFLSDDRLVASCSQPGGARLGFVSAEGLEEVLFPFSEYSAMDAGGVWLVAIAGSATEAPAVVRLDPAGGSYEVLRQSRQRTFDPSFVSLPEPIEFPTGDGEVAHGLFYPPVNPGFTAPGSAAPPLLVRAHGGPTSQARSVLNLEVQFWTTRGFAVVDVDYRGSSGYGREYRQRLERSWGVVDVEDCVAAVGWLASVGRVDGRRAVIRGGSAGGFLVLACLAFTDAFAAGADLFGVADLELLARDTHKFESRYLDRLVGPLPEAQEVYRQRSPIYHVERIDRPLIIFQGLEDEVVPPAQSEMIYQALRGRGVPVVYLSFDGEQHGFRRAETIVRVAQAELQFYGWVLGFEPADAEGWPPLEIANER